MLLRSVLTPRTVAGGLALALGLAACGDDGTAAGGGDRPSVVVTTSILGDVVENLVGDAADVEVLMPRGADPHEAALSTRAADDMAQADLVVVNGAGFEQAMTSVIESVEEDGGQVFAVTDHIDTMTFAEGHDADAHAGEAEADEHAAEGETEADEHAAEGEAEADEHAAEGEAEGDEHAAEGDEHAAEGDEHASEGEAGDEHGGAEDGHGHDEDEVDPHFWTDVTLMADAAEALGDELAALDGIDAEAVRAATDDYVAELGRLDAEVNSIVATIPDDRRTLVTNHEVFGYFAARWGFEVVGTVIPAGTTQADPSSAEVEALAEVVEEAGVPAIFAETSSPTTLADALAETVGDVEVVELFSESLGEEGSGGETYVDMMRTNAERIAEALA